MVSLVDVHENRQPRILTVDIETVPMLAWVWGAYDQNIAPSQIVHEGGAVCVAARWFGSKRFLFAAEWLSDDWLSDVWEWLDRADIVVTYNGDKFDLPELQRQFVVRDMLPPSPFKSVDLLKVARRRFRFPIKKLEHVAAELGIGCKLQTGGFQLWTDVMGGDEKARARMRRYNVQDVKLTEDVYRRLLPWIPNHPHVGLFGAAAWSCPACGSEDLEEVGTTPALALQYPLFRCQDCGANVRGTEHVGDRPGTKGV